MTSKTVIVDKPIKVRGRSADALARSPALPTPPQSAAIARLGSKKGTIEALIRRSEGCMMSELMAATGWQKHSVRSAITLLRDAGCTIVCEVVHGISRYRLIKAQKVVRQNRPPKGAARPITAGQSAEM